jgi:hypothetical protein
VVGKRSSLSCSLMRDATVAVNGNAAAVRLNAPTALLSGV